MPGSRVRSMPWRSWRQAARMQTGRPLPGSAVRRDDRELLLGHSVHDPSARRRDGRPHRLRQGCGDGGVKRESTAHGNAPRAELRTRVGPRLGRGHHAGTDIPNVPLRTGVGNTLSAVRCGRRVGPSPGGGPPARRGPTCRSVLSDRRRQHPRGAELRAHVGPRPGGTEGEGRPEECPLRPASANTLGAGLRQADPHPRRTR